MGRRRKTAEQEAVSSSMTKKKIGATGDVPRPSDSHGKSPRRIGRPPIATPEKNFSTPVKKRRAMRNPILESDEEDADYVPSPSPFRNSKKRKRGIATAQPISSTPTRKGKVATPYFPGSSDFSDLEEVGHYADPNLEMSKEDEEEQFESDAGGGSSEDDFFDDDMLDDDDQGDDAYMAENVDLDDMDDTWRALAEQGQDPDEIWNAIMQQEPPTMEEFEERNYSPKDPEEYQAVLELTENGKKTQTELTWSIHPPANISPRPCQFGNLPTLSDEWKNLEGNKDPEAFLQKIISPEVLDMLVKYTNINAERDFLKRHAEYMENPDQDGPEPKRWRELDATELWAFFGVLYYMGIEKLGRKRLEAIFGHCGRTIHLLLLQSFTRDRFAAVMRYLRFYDTTVDSPTGTGKRLNKRRKIQEFIDPVFANCRNGIVPSMKLTVDETMLSFKGRCGYIQYMPQKPDKYGLKFYTCCDGPSGALMSAIFYVGKEGDKPEKGMKTRVVLECVSDFADTGRTVVTDRFYTSCQLAHELSKIGLECVGTSVEKRSGFPKEYMKVNLHKLHSTAPKSTVGMSQMEKTINEVVQTKYSSGGLAGFVFSGNMSLVKYEPKATKSAVHLLTTIHHKPTIATKNGKPEAILYYNKSKFGVDLLDQMAKSYTTKRACRRWPMRIFFWILDVAAIQAYIAYRLANPEVACDEHFRPTFMEKLAVGMTRSIRHQNRQLNTPRQKKLNQVEVNLRSLQRKGSKREVDQSLSMSALKRLVHEQLGKSSSAKRSLFSGSKSMRKRLGVYAGRKHCQFVKGCTGTGKIKCGKCDIFVCKLHRNEYGNRGHLCHKCGPDASSSFSSGLERSSSGMSSRNTSSTVAGDRSF